MPARQLQTECVLPFQGLGNGLVRRRDGAKTLMLNWKVVKAAGQLTDGTSAGMSHERFADCGGASQIGKIGGREYPASAPRLYALKHLSIN